MRLLHSILCTDIIVDRESGSTSYIRAFEHGVVRRLPAQVPPFYVGTLWELDPKNKEPFSVGLRMVAPSGETTPLGSNRVKPTGALLHKVNFAMPGLQVKEEGRHAMQVLLRAGDKPKVAMELPLFVFLRQAAEGDAPATKAPPKKAAGKD